MEVTGSLLTAVCGSRAFGLDIETSDQDFRVVTMDGPSDETFYQSMGDGIDLYCQRISAYYNMDHCASPFIVPYYDKAISGECPKLIQFWTENADALADINPYSTYKAVMRNVDAVELSEFTIRRMFKRIDLLLGIIWCRYYTGNMLASRQFPKFWAERVYRARCEDITYDELMLHINECKTRTFETYFQNQPINYEIHDKYKRLIDEILEGKEDIQ